MFCDKKILSHFYHVLKCSMLGMYFFIQGNRTLVPVWIVSLKSLLFRVLHNGGEMSSPKGILVLPREVSSLFKLVVLTPEIFLRASEVEEFSQKWWTSQVKVRNFEMDFWKNPLKFDFQPFILIYSSCGHGSWCVRKPCFRRTI